jgi:DNA-binding CsgD family transcriptional regulator
MSVRTMRTQARGGPVASARLDRSKRARSAVADLAYTALSTSAAVGSRGADPGATLMVKVLQAYSDAVGAESAGVYEHVRDGWSGARFIVPTQARARVPDEPMVDRTPDLRWQGEWLGSELCLAPEPDWGRSLQLMTPIGAGAHSPVCWLWVLARPSADFSTADREVALALQPLLAAVACHYVDAFRHDVPAEAAALVTHREKAVLAMLLAGHRATAISVQLDISVRTVNKHLERIYRKFGVHDRQALSHVITGEVSGTADSRPSSEP